MSGKEQLLDPLGTVCKLISLYFYELHTKISIQNHVLFLQKPNNYQPIMRIINGDTKENISELLNVIVRLIKWYLIKPSEESPKSGENWIFINQSDDIKKLTKYLCISLKKLQETYEYGNVVLAIQFYINIIEDILNGTYSDSKLPNNIHNNEVDNDTLLDYHKLKNLWDTQKLKRICDLYDNCFQITKDHNIADDGKKVMIDGYLSSINATLQITDAEFQKLIANSNRG
jgi:hypothetical protein